MALNDRWLEYLKAINKGDLGVAISLGLLPGVSHFDKFGRNSSVDTTTDPEDVWGGGGLYTGFPTGSAETIEVFSSNDEDGGAGTDTGLLSVRLYGQLSGVEQTEDVILTGTTKATTNKTWTRMYRVRGLTAGATGANLGTITCRHSTTVANVFAMIPIGANRTQICAATVPTGKTLFLKRLTTSITRAQGALGSALLALMIRESGGVWEQVDSIDINQSAPAEINHDYSLSFPAGTDVVVRVLSVTDNATSCSAIMHGIYVDD